MKAAMGSPINRKMRAQVRFDLLHERMRLDGWYEWHPVMRPGAIVFVTPRRMLQSSLAQSRFHARISRRSPGLYGGIAKRRRRAGGLYARRMQRSFAEMEYPPLLKINGRWIKPCPSCRITREWTPMQIQKARAKGRFVCDMCISLGRG